MFEMSYIIKEGERLQKEIDDNQAAQAKNKELREFFTKMHEVAVEELKIEKLWCTIDSGLG